MSPTLMLLSDGAERLFWRLTTVADDFGRFEADPDALRATCFPRAKEMTFRVKTVQAWFEELRACCLVTTYVVNGHQLGFFTTWDKHQRTRAKESKYPAPSSDNICGQMSPRVVTTEVVTTGSDITQSAADDGRHQRNGHGNPTRAQALEILTFLNTKTGKSYRPVPANLGLIEARLKSGATVDDCRGVIARKVREWSADPKMAAYLRPATLFNATKFECYIGEKEKA